MRVKITFAVLACVVIAEVIYAAPNGSKLSKLTEGDLAEKFAEFLHEDKQMEEILDDYKHQGEAHTLHKRETDGLELDADMNPDMPKDDGFLDRAAKFVMELVQRFLKWINSD